jgi:hypothetical protein
LRTVCTRAALGQVAGQRKTAGQTLTADLKQGMKKVTHVGFSTWNTVTDFSPLQDKEP